MNFKDLKLVTNTPYVLSDLVHWLSQELTAREIDEFTDLWVDKHADVADLLGDDELEKLAIDRLDIESLAADNLAKDQILHLAEDLMDADWFIEQAETRLSSKEFAGWVKDCMDDADLEAIVLDRFDLEQFAKDFLDKEALQRLASNAD